MIVGYSRISGNRKTGPIPTTLTEQKSCPNCCPYKADKLCYPFFSPLGFIWESLDNGGYYPGVKNRRSSPITWDDLCNEIRKLPKGQLWRHNTAGDLPGIGDTIDTLKLNELVKANSKVMGFTYTHKPVNYSVQGLMNARAIYAANKAGFRINLSADSLVEADRLADMKIGPVVVVVDSNAPKKMKTPIGRSVIVCPAEVGKVTCLDCKLCAKDRKSIIAFRSHGTKKSKVNSLLKVLENNNV